MNNQSQDLALQFARLFIQRRDVKAVQLSHGGWMPDRALKNRTTQQPDPGKHGPLGFQMDHLTAHLAGTATYGHYLLDENDMCRMFALDIDLEKNDEKSKPDFTGYTVPIPTWQEGMTDADYEAMVEPIPTDVRELWTTRSGTPEQRNWLKYQMGMLARKFAGIIQTQVGVPCAAAYSGGKGIHVYGFTGPMPAAEVREACLMALDYTQEWEPLKGQHFWGHKVSEPTLGYQNFSIETFPKQDSLKDKDLGNLMRLPLGRNLKSNDPTFFLDLKSPIGVMAPHPDPVALLESGNPFL